MAHANTFYSASLSPNDTNVIIPGPQAYSGFCSSLRYDKKCYRDFCTQLDALTKCGKSDNDTGNRGWEGDSFVLAGDLKNWLLTYVDGNSNLEHLLYMVYKEADWDKAVHPTICEYVTRTSIFTFCILLELRMGHLIHIFDDFDKHLPDPLVHLSARFNEKRHARALLRKYSYGGSHELTEQDTDSLAEQFNARQWKYFPADFMPRPWWKEWEVPRVFPYMSYNQISDKGGTARVYEVAIPLGLVDQEWGSKWARRRVKIQGVECGQFALKIFPVENKQLFVDEVNAYRALAQNKGMVGYLGAFSFQNRQNGQTQYVILLEYADSDLEEFFRRSPPYLSDQILRFWQNFAPLLSSLKGLHEFELHKLEKAQRYSGWHADIKPDNILLVGDEFKLADPGFANFEAQTERGKQMRLDEPQFMGGTTTYGSPERYHSKRVEKPWLSDIWSMGCVLSEAVTWVVLGNLGLKQYRDVRRNAIRELKRDPSSYLSQDDKKLLKDADFFHDGSGVLEAVKSWHKTLRTVKRPSDYFSEPILDYIEQSMLRGLPERSGERITAAEADKWFCGLVRQTEQHVIQDTKDCNYPVTKLLTEAIDVAREKEAKELQEFFDLQSSEQRRQAKLHTSYLQLPSSEPTTRSRGVEVRRPAQIDPIEDDFQSSNGSHHPVLEVTSPQVSRAPTFYQAQRHVSHASVEEPEKETLFQTYYKSIDNKNKKSLFRRIVNKAQLPREDRLGKLITERDLVFLIDNGFSMKQHWFDATFAMEMLYHKMNKYDENGMDLYFTLGKQKIEEKKKGPGKFRELMLDVDKGAYPVKDAETNMEKSLALHLNNWLDRYRRSRENLSDTPKAMTLYILTDGKWKGSDQDKPLAVDDVIVKFYTDLKAVAHSRSEVRLVTIQFVSFGNDLAALERLRRLDNDLKFRDVEDIVDSEPATGDIYQMVLGSIDAIQDKKNDQAKPPAPPQSPQLHAVSPTHSAFHHHRYSSMDQHLQQPNAQQYRISNGAAIPEIEKTYYQ